MYFPIAYGRSLLVYKSPENQGNRMNPYITKFTPPKCKKKKKLWPQRKMGLQPQSFQIKVSACIIFKMSFFSRKLLRISHFYVL